MNEVIDKYGVVWISSGGNRGPALFTIGTPPDISTNNIIGNYYCFFFPLFITVYAINYSIKLVIFVKIIKWQIKN